MEFVELLAQGGEDGEEGLLGGLEVAEDDGLPG